MKIGDVARAAGVTTSRIRFYERRGLLPPPDRGANGYRSYSPELVGLLRFMDLAQQLGFTLREVAAVRPGMNGHYVSCDAALDLLATKLSAVTTLIAEAEARRDRIKATMAELASGKEADAVASSPPSATEVPSPQRACRAVSDAKLF